MGWIGLKEIRTSVWPNLMRKPLFFNCCLFRLWDIFQADICHHYRSDICHPNISDNCHPQIRTFALADSSQPVQWGTHSCSKSSSQKRIIWISWEATVRTLAASFVGSYPSFPSRATFTSIYLYQRKRTTRKRRGTSLSKGKPSRQKYKGRESQSSGTAWCLVHAVPGAATAASEYKLLKVSEYEAKLPKVRGSDSREIWTNGTSCIRGCLDPWCIASKYKAKLFVSDQFQSSRMLVFLSRDIVSGVMEKAALEYKMCNLHFSS